MQDQSVISENSQSIEDSFFDCQEFGSVYELDHEKKQELNRKAYMPETKDKIVVSVLDTGIGIKE